MGEADAITATASAEQLRRRMAEKESERLRGLVAQKAREERARRDYLEHFLHDRLTKRDLSEARARVLHAAENGLFEALVMRFPSALCADEGRAINNWRPDWPRTLPGKAREAHALWEKWARPRGFGLRAQILDYPDGMPGDVGLFVTWSPPAA
jgi:hypothetical protein